jgi:hypothetical protein
MARRKRISEADRLRQLNEEMKLAMAENCTVLEARRRLALRRWRAFEERLDRRRRCGTAAVDPITPERLRAPSPEAQPTFWWKDDRF